MKNIVLLAIACVNHGMATDETKISDVLQSKHFLRTNQYVAKTDGVSKKRFSKHHKNDIRGMITNYNVDVNHRCFKELNRSTIDLDLKFEKHTRLIGETEHTKLDFTEAATSYIPTVARSTNSLSDMFCGCKSLETLSFGSNGTFRIIKRSFSSPNLSYCVPVNTANANRIFENFSRLTNFSLVKFNEKFPNIQDICKYWITSYCSGLNYKKCNNPNNYITDIVSPTELRINKTKKAMFCKEGLIHNILRNSKI